MVVKDRKDDDQIVACVRRHGKYQWDIINGIYVQKRHFNDLTVPGTSFNFTITCKNVIERRKLSRNCY